MNDINLEQFWEVDKSYETKNEIGSKLHIDYNQVILGLFLQISCSTDL